MVILAITPVGGRVSSDFGDDVGNGGMETKEMKLMTLVKLVMAGFLRMLVMMHWHR